MAQGTTVVDHRLTPVNHQLRDAAVSLRAELAIRIGDP
jgi:hypothetical protein